MDRFLLALDGSPFLMALIGLGLAGLLAVILTRLWRPQKNAPFRPDEQIYRTLIEQSLMGMAVLQNGQIVFTNPALTDITGYSSDEFRATPVEEALAKMIHQDDQMRLRQMMEDSLTGKPVPPRAEYRFIHKDGKMTWLLTEVSRIEYQRLPALQFAVLDVTSVKKTARELQISRTLLSQAEEIAQSGTFDWDLTNNSVIWSPGMHQLFEIPPDQFNGDPGAVMRVLHPDDVNYLAQAMQEVIQDKIMRSHLEYRILPPSGTMRYIWAQGILLFDEAGNAVRMIGVCSDITVRKQAEEALRESEERFRQLAENIQEVFWMTTPEKDQMLYVNPAYERVWGRSIADLYAAPRTWLEAVHLEDRPRVEEAALTRQIEGSYHEEYRILRGDGTIRWIRDRAFPIFDAAGQVKRIVGVAQDITEYKQAEILQQNYVSFLEMLKRIDQIILGAQTVKQMLNDVLQEMLDVFKSDRAWLFFPCDPQTPAWTIPMEKTRPEYPGAGGLEVELPMNEGVKVMMEDHLAVKEIVVYDLATLQKKFGEDEVARHQTQAQMSMTIYPKIGKPWLLGMHQCAYHRIWTEQEKNLFREIGGRISDSLSSLLLLDNLTQSEARYRAIVEDQTELICRTTPDKTITFVNDAYCRFFGLPREQLIGQSFMPLIPSEFHPLVHQKRTSLTPETPVTSDEFLERNAEGDERWLYWAERGIFDEAGNLVEIQSVGQDVTHRKQAEEEIRQLNEQLEQRVLERTAQLQVVNQELESFSYSVSHDLRTPLRAINGFASLLKSNDPVSLSEEGQTYLNKIIHASARMGYLIDDLLNYSRLGRSSLRHSSVALNELLEEVVFDLQAYLQEVQGTIQIAPTLPSVVGDRTLLHQIFTNLLENALKYRRANVPPSLEITSQSQGSQVIVHVKDNGIGIPAEYREKIFEVFQRLHREDEYPGTGIGLATVKKAVELMGGEIWVEATVGEGSTFFVKLLKG